MNKIQRVALVALHKALTDASNCELLDAIAGDSHPDYINSVVDAVAFNVKQQEGLKEAQSKTQYQIKITGSGTSQDVADALVNVADSIRKDEHVVDVEKVGKCEWENPVLMTTIGEKWGRIVSS